jgi:hypothetical protein
MKKAKTMTLVIAIVAILALVSVGFASWVISINATSDTTGNITVDTVTDNRVDIVVSWEDSKNTICFGAPSTTSTTITNPWLTSNSEDKECLTVKAIVKVYKKGATQNDENLIDLASNKVEFSVVDNANSGFATASGSTKNYVVAPTVASELTKTDSTTGTYSVTITFAWGTAFNSKNPYDYYNGLTATDENANKAKAALSDLKTLLDGVTYKLTITGSI